MVRISIASSSTSTLSAEKQGKPKALVARVALKQGYTGKLERNNDRTGGKIVVDLSGSSKGWTGSLMYCHVLV
uniref:Uncharacterized protein n=1 Tax=Anser brachyrhynchus TaxID=132585 RepID=A0A8B9CG68_9AVES